MSNGYKLDNGKLRYDLIPWDVVEEVVKVLTKGLDKYPPNNWKFVEHAKERYDAAMLRHYSAYKQGEYNDKETGLPHLAHAITCLMFKLWFDLNERIDKNHDFTDLPLITQCDKCDFSNDKSGTCLSCVDGDMFQKKETELTTYQEINELLYNKYINSNDEK